MQAELNSVNGGGVNPFICLFRSRKLSSINTREFKISGLLNFCAASRWSGSGLRPGWMYYCVMFERVLVVIL